MKTIAVVIVEPLKLAYTKEINQGLSSLQSIVEGYIETAPYDRNNDFDFILNEEGKLIRLQPNRIIYDGQDIICGTFVIAKFNHETGDFISMSEEEAKTIVDDMNEIDRFFHI